MKAVIYLFIFCPLFALGKHRTTDVEYNYLTTGYRADLADGRDKKSDYRIDPLGQEIGIGSYSFQLSAFTKLDEKSIAAILVVAKSKEWGNTYYLCIPFGNQQLFELYLQDLFKWDAPISRAFAYVSSTWLAGLAARDMNIEIQK